MLDLSSAARYNTGIRKSKRKGKQVLSQKILDVMNRSVDRQELAGGNLEVVIDGKTAIRLEAGYADIQSGKRVEHDSIFRLYSQTKPVTAAAVALLMERGQLDVGSWVSDFLPGFRDQKVCLPDGSLRPAARPVTVSDLLSMTAGLSYPGAGVQEAETARIFEENQRAMNEGRGMGTVAFADALGKAPLSFDPGTNFKYSSCADVLGAIVEIVSGKPFSRFLKEEFFEPLDMKDTGFTVPEKDNHRFVTCYRRAEEGLKVFASPHLCVGDYTQEPNFASGGAGLVSTLDDYAHFAAMLLNGGEYEGKRILKSETVKWLTSPQLSAAQNEWLWPNLAGYSYGKLMRICVDPGRFAGLARLGEYGWDGWLGTYFANFPREKMTILCYQNTKDAGTTPMMRKIRNLILSEI